MILSSILLNIKRKNNNKFLVAFIFGSSFPIWCANRVEFKDTIDTIDSMIRCGDIYILTLNQ